MTRSLYLLIAMAVIFVLPGCASGFNLTARDYIYKDGETELEGYLAFDSSNIKPRPAVLIVPQWRGITDHERDVAKRLVNLGYAVLVADIYGKGVRPATSQEAGQQASKYRNDITLMNARSRAALDTLKRQSYVDSRRIAVIGYCFGGQVALEAARAGMDFPVAVSFHGKLATENPATAEGFKAKVLVLHGSADPLVPDSEVADFQREMNAAKVDWYLVSYANAKHSFTEKNAAETENTGYNATADRRSFQQMLAFFRETIGEGVR